MDRSSQVPRAWSPFLPRIVPVFLLAFVAQGCRSDEPGNPLPPAEVITGAEFFSSPFQDGKGPRVKIPGDRVNELRRLFDGSRLDPVPARWAVRGELKLLLKGGGTQMYDIYSTREVVGAYSDHLRRYFRGGSDDAFARFFQDAEQAVAKP